MPYIEIAKYFIKLQNLFHIYSKWAKSCGQSLSYIVFSIFWLFFSRFRGASVHGADYWHIWVGIKVVMDCASSSSSSFY